MWRRVRVVPVARLVSLQLVSFVALQLWTGARRGFEITRGLLGDAASGEHVGAGVVDGFDSHQPALAAILDRERSRAGRSFDRHRVTRIGEAGDLQFRARLVVDRYWAANETIRSLLASVVPRLSSCLIFRFFN